MGVLVILLTVLLGFFALKGYLKGKATSAFARYNAAETATANAVLEGQFAHPSWIGQNSVANQLAIEIVRDAVKRGMAEDAAKEWFSHPSIRGSISTMAANLEKQGFSVPEQFAGAAQFAKKLEGVDFKRSRHGD